MKGSKPGKSICYALAKILLTSLFSALSSNRSSLSPPSAMPRAESTKMSTQFYHSNFAGQPYLPSDATQSSPTLPPQAQPQPPTTAPAPKKKHVCPTCDRAFTTSGHLARHSRVHTGERNHKCPFPGCETRCSRQDNLQQQ